ncbi:MAG: sugar phosphate isomerase/epimerase family protein [Bacteroidia bacterium]|nr:sugar phosphate isomerase/epimerase family protein [Bacteroidia bacterium]
MNRYSRRHFLKDSARASAGLMLASWVFESCQPAPKQEAQGAAAAPAAKPGEMFFKISLAEWSLHKALFDKKLDNLDFAATARNEFGIEAIEYVNAFFKDKAQDAAYLAELNKRAADNGVKQLLIMIDGEGGLGDTDEKARMKAIDNHKKWVEAAKTLGCHSIRVNAYGEGSSEAVAAAAVDGLGRLTDFAAPMGINIIVENHGGYSSDGDWMAGVMKQVNKPTCGMLPDFGNFCVERAKPAPGQDPWSAGCATMYDRYKGVELFMPFAKAVSAKSHDFDAEGNETETDYLRIMKIVKDAGYRGYVGIEYEGSKLDEYAGIRATKALLEKVGAQLGA